MKIGIDVNSILFDQSGIGHYSLNIVKNLLLVDTANEYVLCADNFLQKKLERQKILQSLVKNAKNHKVSVKIIPLPPKVKDWLIGTPYFYPNLVQEKFDIYFSPHFTTTPKNGFSQTVTTIHDVIFLKNPEYWPAALSRYYSKRLKMAVNSSKKIIAVSEATKNDLIHLLKVPKEKIKVVYEGVTPSFHRIIDKKTLLNKTAQYLNPDTKFILSVGTLEPRKNLPAVVKAFALLPNEIRNQYKIVFVGGKGWQNEELNQTINDLNLRNKVIFTGFVPDDDLPYIYNRASIFVYPSKAEGFGLPVLEAMACGVPVITSNNSSLPEVMGKAGVLIDPKNEKEIAQAIKNILLKPKLGEKMSLEGIKQAKKFSWVIAAKQTLKVFEEINREN